MKLKTLSTLLLLLIAGAASAALTTGYYRIISYNSKYLTENISNHTLICSDQMESSYSQVWYLSVSGTDVTIMNVLTGRYIKGQGTASAQYTTDTSFTNFVLGEDGSVYTFKYDPNNFYAGGLHCDANLNVVQYNVAEAKSKWTVESATFDASALAAQQSAIAEASTPDDLLKVFTTTACTELKSGYSESELAALPSSAQALATKIKNNTWTTFTGWDKTEKTFRIADYKAYSSGDRWKSILGYKHKLGRLSNPTGIWADAGDIIQVYVGAVPSGQTVALEVAGYAQASGAVYPLSEGMNTLLIASSGNCFVFYEVDNTTGGNAPYTALSNYADVTVHIEGGTVQGYFDLTKGDTNTDWTALRSNLLSKPMVCLKTDKHVMNLDINRLVNALNSTGIVEMLTVWRNSAQWEDELMGRSDTQGQETYGQYCNNVFSVTMTSSGYAHATDYGTCYPPDYDAGIYNANKLMTVADHLWCIAHEQGHNHQEPINMVGQTEVSNNLFSNVAIYKQGRYTSRTASIKETFNAYLDGISWPERVRMEKEGIGNYNQQLLRLNWQLYLFFHVNGKDPDFFPRLFDALRADPITKVSGANTLTPADTDYLKYYIKCCQVSGFDLTDFFASYGFFMLPPEQATSITYNNVTTNRYQSFNDYADYNLYVTQTMIDAAKTTVAAMNLPKCNIVFIEDRVTAPDATYEGAAGAKKTINPDAPVGSFGEVGEMGQYTAFNVVPSAYTFNVDEKGHVTTSGTGAVGFIVYNASGDIVGFYNTSSFKLPATIGSTYTIKAAAGDGTQADATKDTSIPVVVTEFPRTDKWYSLVSQREAGRYVASTGADAGMVGTTASSATNAMQWRFAARNVAGTSFDIINRNDGSYIDPTAANDTQISTTTTQPASGWTVTVYGNYYYVSSGSAQLHQGGSGHSYNILNWGGGSKTDDTGCLFTISAVDDYTEPVTADVLDITNISDNETDVVAKGTQITSAPSSSGKPYLVQYYGNQQPIAYVAEMSGAINAKDYTSATKASVYYFYDNGDGTWKLQNYCSGKYWNSIYGKGTSYALAPVDETSAGSWTLDFTTTANQTYFSVGSYNLARSGTVLHGWDSKSGYGFKIYEVEQSSTALPELTNKSISVSGTAANTLETGQWYVMFDRGTDPGVHGYLYENSSSHTLYNTATAPVSNSYAPDNAKYLVRIVGENGNYYLQTGFGNYFGEITASTAVPTTALKEQLITVKKIDSTNGHYYLASSAGVILDANDVRSGDATVVGWGTTVPTATGGNNDWAFYPVELVDVDYSISVDDVTVTQGYQTTGRGNENALLLRIDATPFLDMTEAVLTISLDATTQANISSLYLYESDATEFIANIPASKLATAASIGSSVTLNLGSISAGTHHYWLCATIKNDATLGDILDAAVTGLTYTNINGDKELDLTSVGNPARQGMKVFAQQTFLTKPTQDNCRYWRIPALIKDQNGDLVAAVDKRYNSNNDLGNHKIDVVSFRSSDGGRTWGSQATVAAGDGSSASAYGFGDAGLSRTADGKLVCIMAAGNKAWNHNSTDGQKYAGVATSADNGASWTLVPNIFATSNFYDEVHSTQGSIGFENHFATSGKALTTSDGILMYTTNCVEPNVSSPAKNHILYSVDNGIHWRLSSALAYSGTDESKLVQLSDGSLLLSVRQSGNRGWNKGTYTKNNDGTVTFSWGEQYRNSEIWGNACNADIINYGREIGMGSDLLIHSYINTSGRESLQLAMSIDGGDTWTDIYNIQPNGSCYSTMQVLDDGTLAILFEDESYSAGNGYATNFVTITPEQVEAWYEQLSPLEDPTTVKVADFGSASAGPDTYGAVSSNVWTSNATSGKAGLTIAAEGLTMAATTAWDQKIMKLTHNPNEVNHNGTLTITAPNGYIITGITFKGGNWSSNYTNYITCREAGNTATASGSTNSSQFEMTYSNLSTSIVHIDIRSGSNVTPFAITNCSVTIAPGIMYNIVDAAGTVVASNGTVITSRSDVPTLPNSLKRPYCTYSAVYSDAACTSLLPTVGTASKAYVRYAYENGPVEFSTAENPKWYLVYSHKQNDSNDYYANANGSALNSTTQDRNDIYSNTAYWWAFIGNPYNVQLLNKQQDAYLSAAAMSGANGSAVSSAITSDANRYPYNSFSLYGFSNGNVVTTNPFSLVLNGSSYEWVNGNGAIYYHSGVAINSSLQLTGWKEANLMVNEIPTIYEVDLNVVGDASYATLYLPFDVTTDANTEAYYIGSVENSYAKLTKIADRGIPARTAVVLVNNNKDTSVNFDVTSGLASVVDAGDNLLKGTLTSMTLDLSDGTPNYSLGRKKYPNDEGEYRIGFYKFQNGSTTSITLGANKAYLESPIPSPVKGFVFDLDEDPNAIVSPLGETEEGAAIYNLAGQCLGKPQRGVNIINGKKILK